jgi:hypothetical protein
VPTALEIIQEEVSERHSLINLDNGCVYKAKTSLGFGNLLCLNLDTYELTIQPNID